MKTNRELMYEHHISSLYEENIPATDKQIREWAEDDFGCEKMFNDRQDIIDELFDSVTSTKRELTVAKSLLKKMLEANTPMLSPLHNLHPSHYTVLFAHSLIENNLDIDRAEKFINQEPEV